MKTSPCKHCGREITWAKSPTGADIPLARVKIVYTVSPDGNAVPLQTLDEPVDWYISHFVDCPGADRFGSGARRTMRAGGVGNVG